MYYSSDSSDSENVKDYTTLDLSYLLLDSESVGSHLKNSILEYVASTIKKVASNNESHGCEKIGDYTSKIQFESLLGPSNLEDLSVRKRSTPPSGNDEQDTDNLKDDHTTKLLLHHNLILNLPVEITNFENIKYLDLSNNNLSHVNDFLLSLVHLQTLYIKNNELRDDSLPKDLSLLSELKELNLSGNYFTKIPEQVYQCLSIKYLYMASNDIDVVLPEIQNLQNLQILHLGGNHLERVPDELGNLQNLGVLALCDNRIRRLPRVISKLTRLRSLLLHKNNMCCLPVEIVKLKGLTELSLRENPLVNKFVKCCANDYMNTPPSLLELSARTIKLKGLAYAPHDIPSNLYTYINSGQKCVNSKCKGVYFTSCVEHIKFVDFCGKYRVPLMHYLCSSKCSSATPTFYRNTSESESEDEHVEKIRKVLLG